MAWKATEGRWEGGGRPVEGQWTAMEGAPERRGRSWRVVEGRGGSWRVVEGRGRSWKVVEGRGRSWKVVEGRARSWRRVVEGRGRRT